MFTNVLVGVDGREGGRDAMALAKRLAPDARLTLAHIFSTGRAVARGGVLALPFEPEDSQRLLEGEKAGAGVDAELMSSSHIPPARGLGELAKRVGADLLIVGASRHCGLAHVLMGDDARATLNVAPCAVAIAPRGYALNPRRFERVGVAYDGSPERDDAFELAREIASRNGAALLTLGRAQGELERLSEDIDLLLISSRGNGRLGRLLRGGASNYLVRHSACALLVVPRVAIASHTVHAAAAWQAQPDRGALMKCASRSPRENPSGAPGATSSRNFGFPQRSYWSASM